MSNLGLPSRSCRPYSRARPGARSHHPQLKHLEARVTPAMPSPDSCFATAGCFTGGVFV
jgi:hypothetical protein